MIIALICVSAVVLLLLIYLYMIGTRIKRADIEPFRPYMYAHRGLHNNSPESEAPENTLAAFRKAVEGGYGIEFDVQLSKDNVPVIFHDAKLDRMCGQSGKVWEYTLEELKQFRILNTNEQIPTLEEALQIIQDKVPILVEYKLHSASAAMCPLSDELLIKYGCRYMIESFQPMALWWYRKHRKDIVRGMLSEHFAKEGYTNPLYLFLKNLLFNHSARPDFIAFHKDHTNLVTLNVCKKLYRPTMVAWTIQSQEQLEKAMNFFEMFIFDSFVPEKGAVNPKYETKTN